MGAFSAARCDPERAARSHAVTPCYCFSSLNERVIFLISHTSHSELADANAASASVFSHGNQAVIGNLQFTSSLSLTAGQLSVLFYANVQYDSDEIPARIMI